MAVSGPSFLDNAVRLLHQMGQQRLVRTSRSRRAPASCWPTPTSSATASRALSRLRTKSTWSVRASTAPPRCRARGPAGCIHGRIRAAATPGPTSSVSSALIRPGAVSTSPVSCATSTLPTTAVARWHNDGCCRWLLRGRRPHPERQGRGLRQARKYQRADRRERRSVLQRQFRWPQRRDVRTSSTTASARCPAIYGGSDSRPIYGSVTFDASSSTACTTRFDRGASTGAGDPGCPSGQQLTKTYGGNIMFEHGWSAEWRTSVFGGVERVDYNETANAILCSQFRPGSAAGTLSNLPCKRRQHGRLQHGLHRVAGVGSRTTWTPVKDLLIGAEFQWSHIHVEQDKGADLPAAGDQQLQAGRSVRGQGSERVLGHVLRPPLLLIGAA